MMFTGLQKRFATLCGLLVAGAGIAVAQDVSIGSAELGQTIMPDPDPGEFSGTPGLRQIFTDDSFVLPDVVVGEPNGVKEQGTENSPSVVQIQCNKPECVDDMSGDGCECGELVTAP